MPVFSYENINTGDNRPEMPAEDEKQHLYISIFMPLVFLILMWLSKIIEVATGTDFSAYGILPKHFYGLRGILLAPFIHGDWQHLISNSFPFLILAFLMIFNYRKVAFKSFVFIYFASGLLVWLFGRENYHIGSSNLVYGFAFFIFFSGIFRKNIQSIALSLFVVFLYGSIVWGMFPIDVKISWEGHLMGAISGTLAAFYFRKVDLPPELVLEDTDDDDATTDQPVIVYEIKPVEEEKK